MNTDTPSAFSQPDDLRSGDQSFSSTESVQASVATLVSAGLPLESGLRALSEEAPSSSLRLALRRMSDELASGQSPEQVLSRSQWGLPNYLSGLVRAGVQSGKLGEFLEQFLLSVRRRRQASASFWRMMAYPLFLTPLVLLIATAVLAFIVPQFQSIFSDFGVALPGMTQLLINLSHPFIVKSLLFGIPLFVLITIAIVVSGPYIPGHATRLRWFQYLPVLGTPSRMRGLSEFCSLLGLLVTGQIPLPEALAMTASALHDANLSQGARRLAARVEQGESLEAASLGLPQISAELKSLFRWEPRGAAFGDILMRAGEVYSARAQVQAGASLIILQPLIFLGLGLFIGFIVLALFMPLVKLLNELS
ncbi:MAG: type II secretion system F family protein [Planctomycetaceae bacterium]